LASCQLGFSFAHGFSFQIDLVSVVNQAIHDGIGQGGITDDVMSLIQWQLTGDDGGAAVITVFEDFQQITALLCHELA
jgi:hypothetical protein